MVTNCWKSTVRHSASANCVWHCDSTENQKVGVRRNKWKCIASCDETGGREKRATQAISSKNIHRLDLLLSTSSKFIPTILESCFSASVPSSLT